MGRITGRVQNCNLRKGRSVECIGFYAFTPVGNIEICSVANNIQCLSSCIKVSDLSKTGTVKIKRPDSVRTIRDIDVISIAPEAFRTSGRPERCTDLREIGSVEIIRGNAVAIRNEYIAVFNKYITGVCTNVKNIPLHHYIVSVKSERPQFSACIVNCINICPVPGDTGGLPPGIFVTQ